MNQGTQFKKLEKAREQVLPKNLGRDCGSGSTSKSDFGLLASRIVKE